MVKNPPANAGDIRDLGYLPGLERVPWRRKWQSTPGFLSGEFPWTRFSSRVSKDKYGVLPAAAKSLQSCPTLRNPMDSSPPGSSVHRIL